jgi:hypothetical protein
MPTTKRIVVLANSIKHAPARCVADREVEGKGGSLKVGDWIRPVSTKGEGELQPNQLKVAGAGQIGVLEVFDVSLISAGTDPAQPENWIIDDSQSWRRVDTWPIPRIGALTEMPRDLWLEPGSRKSDRTSEAYIRANPPSQSLFFLVLSEAYLCQDQPKKYRLHFNYAGISYDLSVTDPLVRDRMLRDHRDNTRLRLTSIHVCVSLTPVFRGDHYKIIAAMIW